ncbi:MAG: hypothetical protein K0S88_169 [Actinomycetia bacterium]|nr:hypothetical protein [Actinomycetes bacterium]
MPRMLGNLSIRSKLLALLAVPVAGTALLGATGLAATASDRLGLVVVARLAARNGFGVRLGRSPAGGLTAAVRLPAAALESGSPVPARLP